MRDKFQACGKWTGAGFMHGGSECINGMLVYSAMRNGVAEQETTKCACLLQWIQDHPFMEAKGKK